MSVLHKSNVNGWSVIVRATTKGERIIRGTSTHGQLCHFYAEVGKIPSRKQIIVTVYADATMQHVAKLIQYARQLATANGRSADDPHWWRKRLRDGSYYMYFEGGDPIDVDEVFAQIVESIDLKSEVTA
jgi:hypothetical protein